MPNMAKWSRSASNTIILLEGDSDGFQEAVMVYVEGGAAVPADDVWWGWSWVISYW